MKKINKILAGCIGCLAVVSVASIGFATWLVGVTQNSLDLTIAAEVDSVQNQTQYVDAVLVAGQEIAVAEESVVKRDGKKIVGTAQNDGDGIKVDENALSFKFESITVRIGDNVTGAPNKVKIELKDDKNEFNKVTTNTMTETYRKASSQGGLGYWTYLSFSTTIDLDSTNFNVSDKETYTEYTLKDPSSKTYKLNWGTYFGSTRPTSFYNNLIADQEFNELLTMSQNAYTELDAMHKTLSGKQLTLSVSLVNE